MGGIMDKEYVGIITSFRIGNKRQYQKQCLVEVLNESGEEVKGLIGWKVFWPADNPKIRGKIIRKHGNKGVLRVKLNKGLPGQAVNKRVRIVK
jgi:large subunit ribosomal protein L35Ae